MPAYNTTAIVIHRRNFSETDKILTLFSSEHGRFTAIAKGARKTVSRLSGATELLTLAKFALATGKSMDVVTQTEVIESFPILRRDLVRLAYGLYFADLIDHSSLDNEPNPGAFNLLITALSVLEEIQQSELAARWFEIQLLADLGYQPNLDTCAICGRPLEPDGGGHIATFALSASQGGAVCSFHARPGLIDDHSALSTLSLRLMRRLADVPVEHADRLMNISAAEIETTDQLSLALRRYIRARIERELKSLAFLDSIRHSV